MQVIMMIIMNLFISEPAKDIHDIYNLFLGTYFGKIFHGANLDLGGATLP